MGKRNRYILLTITWALNIRYYVLSLQLHWLWLLLHSIFFAMQFLWKFIGIRHVVLITCYFASFFVFPIEIRSKKLNFPCIRWIWWMTWKCYWLHSTGCDAFNDLKAAGDTLCGKWKRKAARIYRYKAKVALTRKSSYARDY